MTTKAELAEYLRDSLTGGEAYLLDCFMQERAYEEDIEPFAKRLFEIEKRRSTSAYPIGLSNPEAKSELWAMVRELEGS